MFSTYNDLVDYFQTMPSTVVALRGATVGDDEEIENLQNTRATYPHLWVETPDIDFVGTDVNPASRFHFNVAVIANDPMLTNRTANALLSDLHGILSEVWARVLADSDDGLFDLILKDEKSDAIRKWSGDNIFGWRMAITLEIPRCEC
jgi:hypothetical protein